MTTENDNKTKLNLRPSIGIGDKQQQSPPTKLLINHGKPNYTIDRSVIKTNRRIINKNSMEHNGLTINLRKIQSNTITASSKTKKSNDSKNNEFLQKRQQIYDKIEKENSIEENGYMNKIENAGSTLTTLKSPKEQSYVKQITEQLQNGTLLKSSQLSFPKSQNLLPSKFKNYNESSSTNSSKISSLNNDANFEQKCVVSFPKNITTETNKYPDTAKVLKSISSKIEPESKQENKESHILQELTKLKFDIDVKEDVIIKPVILKK